MESNSLNISNSLRLLLLIPGSIVCSLLLSWYSAAAAQTSSGDYFKAAEFQEHDDRQIGSEGGNEWQSENLASSKFQGRKIVESEAPLFAELQESFAC